MEPKEPTMKKAKVEKPLYLQYDYQSNRNGNNRVFKKFYLIRDAVQLSDKNGNLPIFAYDKPNPKNKGAKWFYVGSFGQFYHFYKNLDPQERCFYETLLPDQLCNLYADIEGMCKTNPNVDFEAYSITVFRRGLSSAERHRAHLTLPPLEREAAGKD